MRTALVPLAILFAAFTAQGQVSGSIHCLTGVTSVPTFSLLSTVGVVGDFTIGCTNSGFSPGTPTGAENFSFFMNVTELNVGGWTLTQGPNTYSGALVLSNTLQFLGVTYDPNQPTLSFELHGVEVNPSLQGPGFVFREAASVNGPLPVSIDNAPDQIVAVNENAPEPATSGLCLLAIATLTARFVYRRRISPLSEEI